MSEPSYNRPPRIRPRWSAEEVALPAPPAPPQRESIAWLNLLMPLAGAALFALAGGLGGGSGWLIALPTGTLALLGIGAALYQSRAEARRAATAYAERLAMFEDQLHAGRGRLRRLYEQERTARLFLSPEPAELLAIAGAGPADRPPEPRLWERRPADDDYLELRAGCGSLPAACVARVPPPGPDAAADRRLHSAAAEHATLRQVPICLPLAALGSLGIAGPRVAALALTRAMLWQALVLHGPADLRVAALCPPRAAGDWAWLRWLPHSVPLSNDPAHELRMCAGDQAAVAGLLGDLLDELGRRRERRARPGDDAQAPEPWLLLVVDGVEVGRSHPAVAELIRSGPPLRIAVIALVPGYDAIPEACAAVLEAQERSARWARAGEPWPRERFSPDRVEHAECDRLARRLAGVRLLEAGGSQDVPRSVRLFDLLGVADASDLSPPRQWDAPLAGAWRPDVPIGALAEGRPLYLDLGEGAHGPHGIIAGATGAGKSVLLQSLIAALAASHPPERMQLLLIDFKGGAALAMFEALPHTAGMVTDLEGRMAARAIVAIKSELRRRKAVLKQTASDFAAKVEHIGDYRSLAATHDLPPLPNLLIVVDEFDELARSYPEFVGELVRVVKQGRSLGVHLLLATQQPARAVSNEIRSQLKCFIALRLGGGDDSREMILKPDAAFLPTNLPGRAYFRVGGEVRLFQVALVTGEHRPPAAGPAGPRVSFVGAQQERAAETPAPGARRSDLDILIAALRAAGERRLTELDWRPAPIWLPPLPNRLALGSLPAPASERSGLALPIGLLDIPQEGRREPLALDLAAAHLAVIGAPGSGKTTLLRSLVLAAARHSPRALWIYLVDAGGHGLSPLVGLPHVGALIQARERERVRRLVRSLDATLRERQDLLRAAGAADLSAFNAGDRQLPAILVLIDKIAVLREEMRDNHGDGLIDDLVRIARIGRPLGVHLVVSAERAADLSYKLLALLEARVALRLPELHDYSDLLGARVVAQLPADRPGRGLWAHPEHGPLELQVALPTLAPAFDDGAEAQFNDSFHLDPSADLREAVAAINAAWQLAPDERPQPIELLPDQLALADLPALPPAPGGLRATIGRESTGLEVAGIELCAELPHALVIGPRRSGKTTVLRTFVGSLAASHRPDTLRLLILDSPRGGLRNLRDLSQTALYGQDEAAAEQLAAQLAAPPAGAARRLVIIDDYAVCRERLREQLGQSYSPTPNLFALLCAVAQGGQDNTHLVVAADVAYADDLLLRALDSGRCGVLLWPGRYDSGTRLLGLSLPLADQRDAEQPPGRALLVRDGEQQIVQIATPPKE